jgi:hypothetical protein
LSPNFRNSNGTQTLKLKYKKLNFIRTQIQPSKLKHHFKSCDPYDKLKFGRKKKKIHFTRNQSKSIVMRLVTKHGAWIGSWIYWTMKFVATVIIALSLIHALIAISNYITTDNSHTLQFSTAPTKSSQSAVFLPVVPW